MMHILRRQPEMSHNRETGLSKAPNGLRNGASALQLHGSSAPFLEEPCRVLHGLLGRNLVGQKGHVCHHQRAIGPSRNRTRMMDHRIEGYRNCRIQSQNDIPERISDEQKIDPGSIEQPGHSGIVGRQHDDSLAPLLHQDEVRHSDLSGRRVHHEDLFTTLESQTSRLVITLRRLQSKQASLLTHPSYLKDNCTRARYAVTLPFSTFRSVFTTSATRKSRSVRAAVSTAILAASSQDFVLVPIISVTLYTAFVACACFGMLCPFFYLIVVTSFAGSVPSSSRIHQATARC